MEQWRKDARNEAIIVDLETLVPQDHLLQKIKKVMDYEWLYERLAPYYCHTNAEREKLGKQYVRKKFMHREKRP